MIHPTMTRVLDPRQEPYYNSTNWKQTWQSQAKVDSFWLDLFHYYAAQVDFAAITPQGAIWHLDHLVDFSNQAFDAGKALPLLDCGHPGHDPPCDQIPNSIQNHLREVNKTVADMPNDMTGALCGGRWGCRHFWCTYVCLLLFVTRSTSGLGHYLYSTHAKLSLSRTHAHTLHADGGSRSHALRGELNAEAIL